MSPICEHGKLLKFCVECRARKYAASVNKGLISNTLKEGKPRGDKDPSELQIKYRAIRARYK